MQTAQEQLENVAIALQHIQEWFLQTNRKWSRTIVKQVDTMSGTVPRICTVVLEIKQQLLQHNAKQVKKGDMRAGLHQTANALTYRMIARVRNQMMQDTHGR